MSDMIQAGKTASATTVVTESNTALAVGSGSLNVFATPMMVALMEKAKQHRRIRNHPMR